MMNMLRLALLRHMLLEELPVENFNMKTWLEMGSNGCGTAACALGSAAVYSPFMALGLGTHESFGDSGILIPAVQEKHLLRGYLAGAKFFDISLFQSEKLFDPHEYPFSPVTKEHVIEAITKLIGPHNPFDNYQSIRYEATEDEYIITLEPCTYTAPLTEVVFSREGAREVVMACYRASGNKLEIENDDFRP